MEPAEPHYDSLLARVERMERKTERYLASCPAHVQPVLRAELTRRRGRKGLKPGSNENWAKAWAMMMREVGDRNPADLTPEDWEAIVDRWLTEPRPIQGVLRPLSRAYVSVLCVNVSSTLGRFFPGGKCPEDVREALAVSPGPHKPKGRVLSDADFRMVLDYVTNDWAHTHNARQVSMAVALLWCLRDSWMRVNELLGLNLGDVDLSGPTGTLVMRDNTPLQKRGPRPVPILAAVPALKVWMEMHPAAGNANAPLFCNWRDRTGLLRLCDNGVDSMLKLWGERSGLHDSNRREKKLSAHDFRHTGNTQSSRNNTPRVLRAKKAGWSPESTMMERYDAQNLDDLREQMLRDEGIDAAGFRQQVETGKLEATVAAIVERVLSQRR